MIDLGLSPQEQAALNRTLCSSHLVGVTAQIMTLNHTHLGFFSGRIISGQVNIDAEADVTRQLQLVAFDPNSTVDADLLDGSARLDRMVRIHYGVYVEELGLGWVNIPVFTGPITKTSRDPDGLLSIEAMGKEWIANKPSREAWRRQKGLLKVDVIRSLLTDLVGESRYRMPPAWGARMPSTLRLSGMAPPWPHAKKLARTMTAQLFYDGRGTVRLRHSPLRPTYVFRGGDGGTVLSVPDLTEDASGIINLVKVVGAVPTGKKEPVIGIATLPPADPYSPESLAIHGRPQYFAEDIDDDSVRSLAEAKKLAKSRLLGAALERQAISMQTLPIPTLEEDDPIRVEVEGIHVTTRLTQMTIPLGHEGVSTIGYIAPVSKRRRRY